MKIYIDFESRSQADIWQVGAWMYSVHPSTEILCLAVAIDDGPVTLFTRATLKTLLERVSFWVFEGAEFHAHNAYFERCMWQNIIVNRHNGPPIPLRQWRCTAAKAAAHSLPRSLEKAALAMDLKAKKDTIGSRVMKQICTSIGAIEQNKLDLLYKYCIQDVRVERELDNKLPDLHPQEQEVWFLDQEINDRGVYVDKDAAVAAVECINQEVESLTEELQIITGGEISAGTQRNAIKNYLELKGLKLPDLRSSTIKSALDTAAPTHRRVLQLRRQLSQTSNAKYQRLVDCVDGDNRIRDILLYHGASTGRWSGKLVQLQNLPRPKHDLNYDLVLNILKTEGRPGLLCMYTNILEVLSGAIRSVLTPTPGYDMFAADFSAIEARYVMWLAGEQVGVDAFKRQDLDPKIPDIYVKMAQAIYRKKELTKADKQARQLGKQAVLGCGFGMGAAKFQATCANYGLQIDENLALRAVNTYRTVFSGVKKFWYAMENGAKNAVNTKKPQQIGQVLWYMDGAFLRLKLPSGRTLAYQYPKVDATGKLSVMTMNNTTKQYLPDYTWGGKLVENATQAVARDQMVYAMRQLKSFGYRILFTVHDEIVFEAPTGTKTVEDALTIIKQPAPWAKDCPINAECEKMGRYRK